IHGIVKQHEGWIEVFSEVGRGSSFAIYLPACDGFAALHCRRELPEAQQPPVPGRREEMVVEAVPEK
ncbi:MAG: hypothetical protein ACTHLW_06070, partial [Verrucomicrobiota bacterium]